MRWQVGSHQRQVAFLFLWWGLSSGYTKKSWCNHSRDRIKEIKTDEWNSRELENIKLADIHDEPTSNYGQNLSVQLQFSFSKKRHSPGHQTPIGMVDIMPVTVGHSNMDAKIYKNKTVIRDCAINPPNDFWKPWEVSLSVFDQRHLIVFHKPFIKTFYPSWKGTIFDQESQLWGNFLPNICYTNINLFSGLSQYVFQGKPNDVKLIAVVWKLLFDLLYHILCHFSSNRVRPFIIPLLTAYGHPLICFLSRKP